MKEDIRIFFRPERCVGCLSCLLACQMEALGASEIEGVPVGVKPDERMRVTYHQGTPWLWKCQQCASAPCAEACISGSLRQEPGGVSHDPERCVGCGSCSLVCPFGMIRPLEGQDRMTKCNLCREEAVPSLREGLHDKGPGAGRTLPGWPRSNGRHLRSNRGGNVDSGMTNREPWPLCGYGRLGLCCSACLLGPCRLTPFDELPDRGRCGRDRDQLVAFNLHQAVAIEALQAIRSLGTNTSSGPSERLEGTLL